MRHETSLARALRERILTYGPITFHEFMTVALYDPVHGFYTKGPSIGTPKGTFNTNAMFKAFAFALARAVEQTEDLLGRPLRIVELGGGTGELGTNIQTLLSRPHDYIVVETSGGLRSVQRTRGLRVVAPEDEIDPCPSFVFGNEVLDALPVHRVMNDSHGNLLEMYVALDGDEQFTETFLEPSTPALMQRLENEGVRLGRGQLAEICLEFDRFLEQVAAVFSDGYLFFIDYGDRATRLYHHSKRNGTLRTFYGQARTYDVFDRVGDQDITADVDYTAVIDSATRIGLDHVGVQSQTDWLKEIGIADYVQISGDPGNAEQEIVQLCSPASLGSTFDVLAFKTPGLPHPRGF